MLQEIFEKILSEYPVCRATQAFKSGPMGEMVRETAIEALKKGIDLSAFITKGSVGQDCWADVPWISILHPNVTRTTRSGVRIVYLFSADGKNLYLTLNQGYADCVAEMGKAKAVDQMHKNESVIWHTLTRPVGFIAARNLRVGNSYYDEGCIYYKQYECGYIPTDEILAQDLVALIHTYDEYRNRIFALSHMRGQPSAPLENHQRADDCRDAYCHWAQSRFSLTQINQMLSVVSDIENFCTRQKKLLHSFFEIYDATELEDICKIVLKNKIFTVVYRQKMTFVQNLIDSYAAFLSERESCGILKTEDANIQTPCVEAVTVDIKKDIDSWPREDATWTLGERALLLELYLTSKDMLPAEQESQFYEFSTMLRDAAQKAGHLVYTKYRNYSGIKLQCYSMAFIRSNGESGIFAPSKSAQLISDLYDSNRILYQELLAAMKAKIQEAGNMPVKTIDDCGMQDDEVVSFTYGMSYAYTRPISLKIFDETIPVQSWTGLLLGVCEQLLKYSPSKMRSLIENPLFPRATRAYFNADGKRLTAGKELSNHMWVETNFSSTDIVKIVAELLNRCEVDKRSVVITYTKNGSTAADAIQEGARKNIPILNLPQASTRVEQVLRKSTTGMSLAEIGTELTEYKDSQIREALTAASVVRVSEKYYCKENISDFDQMAESLLEIMKKQFAIHNGYTSAKMLFEAAHMKLDDFLFYNQAFDSSTALYDLAKYLFEKTAYKDNQFVFSEGLHIWEREPNYPKSFLGLFIKWARENNGIITRDELLQNTETVGSANPGVIFSNIMTGVGRTVFWQYEEYRFVLVEAVHVDKSFLDTLKRQIEVLLGDDDYVSLGDVDTYFYSTLPPLPGGAYWSPLILEEVLRDYEIGYITIPAGQKSGLKTIDAALIRKDSPIKTFSDVVWEEINHDYTLPREFQTEELRKIFLEKGFIRGTEKMYTMHKTVADDLRFYWIENNQKVIISKQ